MHDNDNDNDFHLLVLLCAVLCWRNLHAAKCAIFFTQLYGMKVSYLLNKLNLSGPRWDIFFRIMAASFGGYMLATSSSLFLGKLFLPIVGAYQAIHIGLLFSFLVYACAAMWVFSVSSAGKAWLGLIKLNLALVVLTWLLMQFVEVSR